MEFDREKYGKGARALLQDNIVIFVEGKSNQLFYQNFDELKSFSIMLPEQGGSSCLNIKSEVEKNPNWYCILDKDYLEEQSSFSRVFTLNYYSLENLVLLNHYKFQEIKEELLELINKDVHNCKFNIYSIDININDKSYCIVLFKTIDAQYHNHIKNTVKNCENYIQYNSVKKLVEVFDSYLPLKIQKHKKKLYFEELYKELKDKSLQCLFNNKQYEKLQNNLLSRKN